MLGYGPAEVYSYLPQEAPLQSFAPEVQAQLIDEEGIRMQREAALRAQEDTREQWAADDELDNILNNAGRQNTPALMQMLVNNPRVMRSQQFPMVNEYMRMRRDLERPTPYSDVVLGPQFANRISNPLLRRQFEDEMVSGVNFETAKRNHLNREHNYNQELALSKAGVPRDQWAPLQRNGLYDEAEVLRMTAPRKETPLDKEISFWEERSNYLRRQAEAQGLMPDESPQYKEANDMVAALLKQRMATAAPSAPAAAPVQQPPATPATPAAPAAAPAPEAPKLRSLDEIKTPEERSEEDRRSMEARRAQSTVDAVWTEAKDKLADKLLAKYPDAEDRIAVLAGVLKGANAPDRDDAPVDDFGRKVLEGYDAYLLKQLGLSPQEVAFEEPGNLRTGSQKVRNIELLMALARDTLRAAGFDVDGKPKVQAENKPVIGKEEEEKLQKLFEKL